MVFELVNLTPHEVSIINSDGSTVAVPPSGTVARVSTISKKVGSVGGADLYIQEVGGVEGLPSPRANTVFIVSTLVRTMLPERRDIASPGELIRDHAGRPTGCHGLVINR